MGDEMGDDQFGFLGPEKKPPKMKIVGGNKPDLGAMGDRLRGLLSGVGFLQNRWVQRGLIFLLLLTIFLTTCLVYIKPNEYGIKVVKLGAGRGVHKEIYGAGYHWVTPLGIQQMYKLPRDLQVLELTNYPESAARPARVQKAAHIQTSDGFFVDVDISILYFIEDPYKVFTMIGPGASFEENGVIPKTEPVLKETLGELTTEDMYNSPLRVQKTLAAKEKLNRELEPKGLKVSQLLVRYFTYSPEIQKNIEEKKLKDQLVFKNQAEGRAATEAANLKKVMQEGEMNIVVKISEGNAYVTRRKAEKELYVRKAHAKADLLIKLAEAKKTELRNTALQGPGVDRMVGLKMAKAFEGLETVILPSDGAAGVNPLDLERVLKLFEVRRGAQVQQGGSK
jgi:regulator of protease activity HflC (stomatin/prohibitin superfamily)